MVLRELPFCCFYGEDTLFFSMSLGRARDSSAVFEIIECEASRRRPLEGLSIIDFFEYKSGKKKLSRVRRGLLPFPPPPTLSPIFPLAPGFPPAFSTPDRARSLPPEIFVADKHPFLLPVAARWSLSHRASSFFSTLQYPGIAHPRCSFLARMMFPLARGRFFPFPFLMLSPFSRTAYLLFFFSRQT